MKIRKGIQSHMMTNPDSVAKRRFVQALLTGCLLFGIITGCKESAEDVSPGKGDGGGATEVGVPDGAAASKTIGAAGGTLVSADNQVTLTIPAGALSKDMEISIQPITNEAMNGLAQAYRFSPDGTTFAKPALLMFRYDPRSVSANSPDAFGVATQGTDRVWYRTPEVTVDTMTHTITTPMPHFSDWTAYELFKIESISLAGANYVELGGSVDLEMLFFDLVEPIDIPSEGKNITIEKVEFRVAGGSANGSVKAAENPAQNERGVFPARYSAPSKNPPSNPVTVVADVTLKGKKAKIQVVKQILVGKDYFRGTFADTPFDWQNLHFMRNGNDVHVGGYNDNPSQSLNILLNSIDLTAPNRTYAYQDRADKGAWAEFASNYTDEHGGWISANFDCAKKAVRVSPGGVTITQISIVNGVEYIQGRLSGTFYNLPGTCPTALRYFPIEGEFRIKNTFSSGRKPASLANFKGK
ncbi:hypothetical protein LZD49_00155 [Dyadobacter sp. CY261]|uniref:hypothetical protein n=1 Tax=Dyadobacter sp. CY261 TaxID=2907203 RepID=UPI001F184181|nr:hypothetical protein [Dyadobacter sp. CY261]MCF0068858.1 hypothetical protein [Dyadobacter sp. CY261]